MLITTNYKRILLISALAVSFNMMAAIVIIPYAQRTANSHMDSGPAIGASLTLGGLLFLVLEIQRFIKRRQRVDLVVAFVAFASILYWSYTLMNLECEKCMMALL